MSQNKIDALIDNFIEDNKNSFPQGTEQAIRDNLTWVLNSSPQFQTEVIKAIASGSLEKLALFNRDTSAGAYYSPSDKGIYLKLDYLMKNSEKEILLFITGHELQHANDGREAKDVFNQFRQAIEYEDGTKTFDLTPSLSTYIDHLLANEARAHIAGWNAVVQAMEADGKIYDNNEIWKIKFGYQSHFLENKFSLDANKYVVSLKEGLVIDKNGYMAMDDNNIARMTEHYALSGRSLGKEGQSTYPESYSASYITALCAAFPKDIEMIKNMPHLQVDFSKIQGELTVAGIQSVGLKINNSTGRCLVMDVSNGEEKPMVFFDSKKYPEAYAWVRDGLGVDKEKELAKIENSSVAPASQPLRGKDPRFLISESDEITSVNIKPRSILDEMSLLIENMDKALKLEGDAFINAMGDALSTLKKHHQLSLEWKRLN